MKKIIFTFIAFFALTIAANATDYKGSVTNVIMNGNAKSNHSDIIFSINDDVLTGNFSIATAHKLDLSADLSFNGTSFTGEGTGAITFVVIPVDFDCTVDGTLEGDTLTFNCVAVTSSGITCSFTFTGTKI